MSDLKNKTEARILEGHSNYINECAFDPTTGTQLASTSGKF